MASKIIASNRTVNPHCGKCKFLRRAKPRLLQTTEVARHHTAFYNQCTHIIVIMMTVVEGGGQADLPTTGVKISNIDKMKYYTSRIPRPLAVKLKEKGMPYIEIDCETYDSGTEYQRDEVWCNNTYAEVFDWLMKKGVYISGFRRFDTWRWAYTTEWRFRIELEDISQEEVNGYIVNGDTWHEAADKAIEKALTLI